MSDIIKPYNRAAIFSGGGTRFVMYCGMYSAMVEHGIKPDIVIATCGASIATAILQTFPNPKDIKQYLASEEFCSFIMNAQTTAQSRLSKLPYYCLKYGKPSKKAPLLLDIFNRYLMEVPQELTTVLPSLKTISSNAIPSIIIGSKVLYTQEDIEQQRKGRKVFEEVWMPSTNCNIPFLNALASQQVAFDKESAITNSVKVISNISSLQATRISMSDMFYIAPAQFQGDYYLGGATNLIPIELATALAKEIWIEKKHPYKTVEEGLVNAVFGYSGNDRLKQVNEYPIQFLDTRDAREVLEGHYVKRLWDWKRLKLSLQKPTTLIQCREDSQQQFNYGYQTVLKNL